MKKKFKNRYFVGTILVLIMYIVFLMLAKVTPFGNNTILKCDLYQQYSNFFSYLKEIILNGKSILLSWNLGLANNFYTTFVYYLISPLNLLVIFFNNNNMYIFIEILIFIKLILIFNSMILYLDKVWNYKKMESVIFGLCYTFSAYVISYLFHIMWLDALYMLPIILIFIEKYIKEGKISPVIVLLSYTIIINYYVGFIVAFFSGVYFVGRYFIINKLDSKFIFKFLKKLGLFLLGIILAFGIAMIVFLPSFMQLKGNMNSSTKILEFNKEKIALFSNVIFNNYNYMFTQKSCLVFSGTFVLVLIPMFYMNKKIQIKEKIIYSLIVIFLLLPIVSPLLNRLWHGMTIPNCFNYRYSFALIFMLILMAFRAYQNKEKIEKMHFIVSIGIFILATLIEIVIKQKGLLTSDGFIISNLSISISMIIFLIMIALFAANLFLQNKKIKIVSSILLIITIMIDLSVSINNYHKTNFDRYFSVEEVTKYDKAMEKILDKIECKETDRIIFMPDSFGSNMSLKYGYSNIGFFTSARNVKQIKNMYKLGYNIQRADGLWITSYSGTWFNYSMAGVKYYITKEKIRDNEIYGFKYIDCIDELYIYKAENTILPFGYYIADDVKIENKNPFEIQNEIINNYGRKNEEKEKYFHNLDKSTQVANITKKVIEKEEKDIEDKENEKINIKYNIKANKNIDIYILSDENLQIYDEKGKTKFNKYADYWTTESGIKQIAHLEKGEEYCFILEEKTYNKDKIFLYAIDNEKLENKIKNENKNNFKIQEIKANSLYGNANFKDDGYLCFEIMYDDGWRVYVDGNKVDAHSLYENYLGIKLEKGKHEIKISYIPRYFKLGCLITLLSSIMTGFVIYKEYNKQSVK